MDHRQQILDLLDTHPKHYTRIIKKTPELLCWIKEASLLDEHCSIKEHVRSALYGETNVCEFGNRKQMKRIHTGFQNCGPAATCECTRQSISESVKHTKSSVTVDQQQQINRKRSRTMKAKYGVEYNSQRESVKPILTRSKLNSEVLVKLDNTDWLLEQYQKHHRSASDIADELGVYYGTVIDRLLSLDVTIRPSSKRSRQERLLEAWIRSLDHDVVVCDRSVLGGSEIDLYVPEQKLGIEVNGLYWHSWNPKLGTLENRRRHLKKTQLAEQQSVNMIHITDWLVNNRISAVKNMLGSKLGLNTVIGARKTRVMPASTRQQQEFFSQYHLQGYSASQLAYCLVDHLDEPTMMMSFSTHRFRGDSKELECVRLCSAPGVTVMGGVSKLVKHVLRETGEHSVISYCDRDLGIARGYPASGFEFVKYTDPGYFYTDGTNIISRYRAQHGRLEKWLPGYKSDLSESENMFAAGYRRYWNTGNSIWRFSR